MNSEKLICLRRFTTHSFDPWWFRGDIGLYWRECNLMGCSYSETVRELRPVGQIVITGGRDEHVHQWSAWQSAADQFGLVTPPWRYKKVCRACGAEQLVADLERET